MTQHLSTHAYSVLKDKSDKLKKYRSQFYIPKVNGKKSIYLCGNSLGLQSKEIKKALVYELDQWKQYGVEGHFEGDLPWMHYHKFLKTQNANLVGAKESEVVVMNTLTTNLHLMMVTFYRPTKERYKIIMEKGAFPSDQYAMESQARLHGLDPKDAIIEVGPIGKKDTLTTQQILEVIEQHKDSVALVMFGGVNYYTGQLYDMDKIAAAGRKAGAYVGFDLAHAAGNVKLELNRWNVDFAVWCSYKYLNAGPGGPSGAFVHERHGKDFSLPRFAGWWGHDEGVRFKMRKGFRPMPGADGWQLSNAQIFSFAAFRASLNLFEEAGWENVWAKGKELSSYLFFLLDALVKDGAPLKIITPSNPKDRGCQMSILTLKEGQQLFDYITKEGVICDWREPNVIRIAAVPIYNCFEDCFRFAAIIRQFYKL